MDIKMPQDGVVGQESNVINECDVDRMESSTTPKNDDEVQVNEANIGDISQEKTSENDFNSEEVGKTGKSSKKNKGKKSAKDLKNSDKGKVLETLNTSGKNKDVAKVVNARGKEKDTAKDNCNTLKLSETIRNLLEKPSVPENVKKSVENEDLNGEFDVAKVARSIMKSFGPIFESEVEYYSKSKDAFDKLISNEEGVERSVDQLEFCLHALKIFAYEIPDLRELIELKFKHTLIRCLLCTNIPIPLCNEAAMICEKLIEKLKYIEDDIEGGGEKLISVYFWLVKRALLEGATRSEVKRVWAMRKLLKLYDVTDTSPVVDTLKAMVVSPNFLNYKEGRQQIAYLLSFNKSLVVPFYWKIKNSLPSLIEKSKVLACSYGEIFNMAWTYAYPEVKEVLEEEVFQRFMEIYLRLDRPNQVEAGIMGKTIFRILSYLHNSRRVIQFSSAITRLYEPILWRSLKFFHPFGRCNAAELFLDVFPLENPEGNTVTNSNLLEKQFLQIMDLLKDESHLTRIVTIRGLILIFERRIECLSNAQCREILSWLTNDLANDGSSYLVRVAVWHFFSSLAASDNPPEFLTSLLPQTTNHFHDRNEKVRKAFTLMLLQVNENSNLSINATDIVPKPHIIARLALEGKLVGKLLSKLYMKKIYTEGLGIMELVKRLMKLIMQSPVAAENLFRWSSNVLKVENAHFIIMAVLVYLRQYTNNCLQNRPDGSGKSVCQVQTTDSSEEANSSSNNESQDNIDQRDIENVSSVANNRSASPLSASPMKKKRKMSEPSISQNDQEKRNGEDEESYDIDGSTAELHAHMLGCINTIWVVFSAELESNPKMIGELYQVLTVCLQSYLRCYKGTPAWYAAIALASLVPLTKLSENTTASSSCLAELRRTEVDTPKAHTEVLIYTLTAWNRGFEIIELAIDYIDPVFKLFQLNSTARLTVSEGKGRNRVVRFVKDGGKEMIGLRFLSLLLFDYHNEQRLLKHHDRVVELFLYLEGIKVVIEARFDGGFNNESSGIATDAFIKECFGLMVDLIPVLNMIETKSDATSQTFISTDQMIIVIEWALRVFLPHVKELENVVEEELASDENDQDEESDKEEKKKTGKRKTKKIKKKKKDKAKKNAAKDVVEDLCLSCLKIVLKENIFMIKTKVTNVAHIEASAKFALELIKNEGKYWFTEDCLELVEAISVHSIAWDPKDEDLSLSIINPSIYSQILLSLTTNVYVTLPLLQRYKFDVVAIRRKLLFFPNILLSNCGSSSENFAKVLYYIIFSCISAVQAYAIKIEDIIIVDKVEDLALGVEMVTQAILSSPKLHPFIVPAIFDFVKKNKKDGIAVVCSISYLYTLVKSNKLNKSDMTETVQSLYQMVQTLNPTLSTSPKKDGVDEDDSFFAEPLAKLNIRKIGTEFLQKIADNIPCQLVRPLYSIPLRKSLNLSPNGTK